MANQKIPLQVVAFDNYLLNPAAPVRQYRLSFLNQSVIKEDKLAENVSLHSGQPVSAIVGVLKALPEAINDYLEAGNPVEVQDIATFRPKIKARSHDAYLIETEDETIRERCSANDITSVTVKATPIGACKSIIKDFQYEVTSNIVEGEDEEEEEGE